MVFNHVFGQSPLARMYWDATNNRPAANNPWLNISAKHPFNVGFDINHESSATKSYVKQVLHYWINEFRIDGFRFDLSKGFTQVNNPSNVSAWGQYDASRIAILQEYANFIWSVDSDNYVILEHFAANVEEKELSDYGMMIWGNMNHEYSEASKGFSNDLTWGLYAARGWADPNLITYMESHDEERLNYRNLQSGNSAGDYDIREINTALNRLELASTFFYTVPGPKMLWQFGELGYDYSINRCTNGSISDNCRLSDKPVGWPYLENTQRKKLLNTTKALIHLKRTYPTFSTKTFSYDLATNDTKYIKLSHSDFDALVIGNFGVTDKTILVPFGKTGTWYDYFAQSPMQISSESLTINLSPGEYRILTTQDIPLPQDFTSATDDLATNPFGVQVFPNPISSGQTIFIKMERQNSQTTHFELFDILSKKIDFSSVAHYKDNFWALTLKPDLKSGVYFIRLYQNDQSAFTQKIIIRE